MIEYLIYASLCMVVPSLITLVIFFKYQRGLTTRIFMMVAPGMGVMVFIGFVSGKLGVTLSNMLVIVPTLAVIGTGTLLWVNHSVASRVKAEVARLSKSSSALAALAVQSSATAAEQSAMVSQVTTTMGEINETGSFAASSARELMEMGDEAVERGKRGLEAAGEAVVAIAALAEIDELADLVKQFADQSNLLAVNASIEAAKAGERGRGFTVVASEMRSLAIQSKEAAMQIGRTIRRTEQGRAAVERVNHTIEELVKLLENASTRGREISGASSQQSAGIHQILVAMKDASKAGADSAEAAGQLERAATGLQEVAHKLDTFTVGQQ